MSTREVVHFDAQSAITTTSDAFLVEETKPVNAVMQLTAGTPATGAKLQFSIDDVAAIEAGTAVWADSPLGFHLVTSSENILPPVTAVRLVATDGTWTLQVRQG